jgi:class 3 adenylate cyclase
MEIGEINRRRGDFEAAEAAFSRANQLGFDPQPSWALARLQQGDLEGARVMIERTLASGPIPTQEGGVLSLPVAVSVYCELGRLERAGELANELSSLAEAVGTAHARAAALEAKCEVQLALQDFEGALESIHASWLLWCEIDAPYEQARSKVMRARVQHALGDDLSSRAELNTAIAAFEKLGARSEADAARRALTAPNVRGPRVHATFVFIDMVGSTPLIEVIGDEAWAAVLAGYERALRLEFERFGGHEANQEGDGFFVAFTDSTAALDCACAIQQHLANRRTEDPAAPHVRIGLHTADAYQRGRDYSGLGVHAAARVSGLADADEILASAASLAEDCGVRTTADRRSLTLKGISDPIEVATVIW